MIFHFFDALEQCGFREYIKTQSMYCTMREGRYIDFTPTAVSEYFDLERVSGEYFDCGSYKSIEFVPEKEDLKYLRSFKFEDLTFRGTVEYRSSCTQPVKDVMTVAAFHTRLSVRLHELAELVESDRTIYMHGYSAAGLKDRGKGEEKHLTALYDRAERLTYPAREMLTGIANGADIRHYIEEYSKV